MSQDTVELLFQDLRAARAFIDRAECKLRRLLASDPSRMRSDARKRPSEPSEEVGRENTREIPTDAPEPRSSPKSSFTGIQQDELFAEFCQKAASRQAENCQNADDSDSSDGDCGSLCSKSRKKGAPKLTRQQVLSNLREFAKGKSLLDLATVNRIFGYSGTTSGSFIKHAVKRGELGMIPVGKQSRFLVTEVRGFIKSYYDSIS